MKRRTFLKTVGAAATGLAVGYRPLFAADDQPERELHPHASGLPRRQLGRTGQKISVVGYPGLALSKISQAKASAALRAAFDAGVNYFDVAPAYGDAEVKMGAAMQATRIPRDEIFLASKTKSRDAAGARAELERSLRRLKTDHLDLYQLHVMSTADEVREVLAPDGALEAFLRARDEGKVRWLGFSAHTKSAALALLKAHKFDTVMYPVNFIEHFTHQFDPEVLALARAEGAAVIAIKPISAGGWKSGERPSRGGWWYRPLEEQSEIDLAIRFSLSLDPVVSVLPTSFYDLAEKSIVAGKAYRPASDADLEALRELAGKYVPLFRPGAGESAAFAPHSEYFASQA